jgi:hypothetical protein
MEADQIQPRGGTSAASRCMNPSGNMTIWVVPYRELAVDPQRNLAVLQRAPIQRDIRIEYGRVGHALG